MREYDGVEPLEQKTLAEDTKLTIQERVDNEPNLYGGTGLSFMLLADTGATMPAWWSTTRDKFLARDWLRCPLFSGAIFNVGAKLATIPAIIEPRDPRIKAQRDLAEDYQRIIYEGTEFGRGFIEFAMKWYVDRWTQDNGAYAEVLGYGPKSGPIRGRAVGLANLDAASCTRTGNPEFPVVYTRPGDGRRFKLHYTRVIYSAQLPSTRDEMNGIGLCWYSRCAMVAQSIVDDLTFKQEKLGKRQQRAILVGKKMTVDVVKAAFQMADEAADNAGLTRMSMFPVVANPNAADVGIEMVSLSSLPDGFEWTDDVNVAMYTIALTGGFPVRWMWPATVVGATKADAMIQHMATAMSGTAHELGTLALMLGGSERGMTHQTGKFLPPTLKIRFDVQDDWIDEVQAGIHNVRAQGYERNITDGAITVRTAREQMLEDGEITEAQFRQMELEAGRTQDGLPVDSLFYSDNRYLRGIDPEDWQEEEVKKRLVSAKRAVVRDMTGKEEAREAVAALEWLLKEKELEEQEAESQRQAQAGAQRPRSPQAENRGQVERQDGQETEEDAEEESEKGLLVKTRSSWERQFASDLEDLLGGWQGEALDDLEDEREPDYNAWTIALVALLIPLLVQAFKDGMGEQEREYGIALDPAEVALMGQQWAAGYSTQLATGLMATTQKVVGSVLPQAGQLTRDEMATLLEPAFGKVRADMIAITETTTSYSAAMLQYKDWLEKTYGLKTELHWVTQQDERVCFLKDTEVQAKRGTISIQDVIPGDEVLGQTGWHVVEKCVERDYTGNLIGILVKGRRLLICTPEHPIWTLEKGWLDASDLNVGDFIQLSNYQVAQIRGVVNFRFPNSNRGPAILGQIARLSSIPFSVLMPIITINLKGYLEGWKQKINEIASNWRLWYYLKIKADKHTSNFGLKFIFSTKQLVTVETTELSDRSGRNTKPFPASTTSPNIWRAAASFRTISPVQVFFGAKYLAASFTRNVLGVRSTAFAATNGISISNGSLDGERLSAYRACFLNENSGQGSDSTGDRAISFVPSQPRPAAVEGLTTMGANEDTSSLCRLMVALIGTKGSLSRYFSRTKKGLATTFTDIFIGHDSQLLTIMRLLYHGLSGKSNVYNLMVNGDPTYFANGILVHNCTMICEPLDGQPESVWKTPPPAHTRCRCGLRLERVS